MTARITLVGRQGCHLCEAARDVIAGVCAETGDAWCEVSIDDDQDLFDAYWERIPVILVDGRPHGFWRVDPERLQAALRAPENR